MAYGLDITDLIYTDADLKDQGTLEDHEIDLDIAGEKNFELRSDTHIMTNGSLWYVDGTEFGGVVGKFETDPDNYKVIYTGRSFRGIQAAKIIEVPEGMNVVSYSGAITSVTNKILEEYDLDDFFVCDEPEIHDDLDIIPVVGKVDILSGTTVYDALIKIVSSINFSYLYEYNAKEKKCHMIPVVVQDWIDMIAYNRDNTAKFKSALNGDFTNHLVCSGIDEDGKRRTIHLFLDENGEVQPYATVDNPIKDEDYILDKSKKVLKGIREIAGYYDGQISVEDNYEILTEQPEDWNVFFGNYYTRVNSDSFGSYEPKEIEADRHITFDEYVTIDSLDITQGEGELLVKLVAGTDWYLFEPETVTIFTFHEDYRNWTVKIGDHEYIVGTDAKIEVPTASLPDEYQVTSDAKKVLYGYSTDVLELNYDYWISNPVTRSKTIEFVDTYGVGEQVSVASKSSSNDSYEPVKAVEDINYDLVSAEPEDWSNNYSYYFKRNWNQSKSDWDYSSYGSSTEIDLDKLVRVDSYPSDWAYNYGDYYYLFYDGIKNNPRSYSGVSRDVYNLLLGMPEDWVSNFGSYYQIAYTVTYKKKKKYHTVTKYSYGEAVSVSGFKSYSEMWVNVPAPEQKKGQRNYQPWPTWVPNKYYSKQTVTDPPGFNPNNCYLPGIKHIRPSYEPGNCFKQRREANPPEFVSAKSVYIVNNAEPYRAGWFSETKDGTAFEPVENIIYIVKTAGDYYDKCFVWDSSKYVENKNGVYYRQVKDHYANLVRNGLDVIMDKKSGDSYGVTVDDYDFNIGDIVGGEDEITKLSKPQKITNKIIKITRGVVYVDYEIGG